MNRAGLLALVFALWCASGAGAQPADAPLKELVLELRIAAQPGVDPADSAAWVERLAEHGPAGQPGDAWRWFELYDVAMFADRDAILVHSFATDPEDFTIWCEAHRALVGGVYAGRYYVLLADTPGQAMLAGQGWGFRDVYRTDDVIGRPAIGFAMDEPGTAALEALTEPHLGRQLAVMVDDKVLTAPTLRTKLTHTGLITGSFTPEEFDELVRGLGAGRDPAGQTVMLSIAACSGVFALVVSVSAVALAVVVLRGKRRIGPAEAEAEPEA